MNHHLKDRIYAQFARISRALASPRRLELIDLLVHAERTVEDLAREAHLSIANASRHLQILRAAQLVDSRKEGLFVYCRLADPDVHALSRAVRALAERRLTELERIVSDYWGARDGLEVVSISELQKRVRAGDVTVVDVRPFDEYRAGHLPHAVSIPLADLERRLAEIPRGKDVVAYCRDRYCVMSLRAVDILHAHGRRARRLDDGFAEWAASRRPIARGLSRTRRKVS
ncbi:MAG: metalloregulator ArsR/SmtB family transcription factor [Deltaproteobacteria bacterium]|nr:metalloregulator ArsR/SmtB family transcription factor [Deltaproteobacteria bacterium]